MLAEVEMFLSPWCTLESCEAQHTTAEEVLQQKQNKCWPELKQHFVLESTESGLKDCVTVMVMDAALQQSPLGLFVILDIQVFDERMDHGGL